MGIVKSLIVFAFTSIILFLITFFSPSYHEVNKESLNSMLKTFKYSEGSNDFKEINNILDSVPTDVTVMYKDKIITSNINRSSQEKRIAEGEKELSHLTKSAQSGDLTLNYQSDNPAYKYTPYIIVLLAGLFSGFAVFWLERKAKKEDDMTDYLKGEVQRLEMLSQSLEAREKDFSKKIEKHIPTTLDEAQKFLKTLLKEKEVMLVAIENHKISEDKLQKSIEKGKYQISETEEKLKEVQTELSKLTRQDKLIEELKARHEKHKTELKEHKQKISELEKLDVQKFESEIDVLKNKLAELDQKYQESKIQTKESKDTIQEMSKYDGESLTKENKELKEKIDMMEDEAKEYQEMMSNSSVGELVREKQEK